MIETDKEHLSWTGLSRYTADLKHWLYVLFQKVHARIGHVEEELYTVKQMNKATYSIQKKVTPDGITYSLVNDITKQSSGDINIDSKGVNPTVWDEDI